MGVRATELRKGTVLKKDNDLLLITDYTHLTPGKGQAIIHIKTKSLLTGTTGAIRSGSGESFETAYLDRRKCQYLYREGESGFVFMDEETYDQFNLSPDLVGEHMGYVKESTSIDVTFHEGTAIGVDLPASVELEVTEAEAAVKGNTATNVKKNAVVETGMQVRVPMHISAGDVIKISTDSGDFQGRVN
ncbi:MAG: elongation factor P [Planctomycetes bacterium]|nr:elongation factor P [Planctomycetota bacterium]